MSRIVNKREATRRDARLILPDVLVNPRRHRVTGAILAPLKKDFSTTIVFSFLLSVEFLYTNPALPAKAG